jgi:F-type H+-transporting ATPase subunit b
VQIDWLTVAAQIVNFLVLVWLLQRFLYRPITQAMARREARIEERLSDARAERSKAEDEAEKLRKKREELDAAREEMLEEARTEADQLRERLEQDIRQDMNSKRETWRKTLEDERAAFARTVQRKAGHQVLDIVGRVLADFTGSDLAAQIASGFAERLDNLDKDTRKKLTGAADMSNGPALVESGVALDANARRRITRAIHEQFATKIEVDYREDEEVLLGVRLTINEQTVEWSAARHLKRLNRELDELLDPAGSAARPAANN